VTFAKPFCRRLAPALALGVSLALLGGCGGSARSAHQPPSPSSRPEYGANVARVPGISPSDVASAAVLAVFPPSGQSHPNGWVLTTPGDWRRAVLAAQFAARPSDAGLLFTNHAFVPSSSQDVLARVAAESFPRSGGVQALLFDRSGRDVLEYLTKLKLKVAQLLAPDADSLGVKLVPFRGGFAHGFSSDVVVVSAQARDYALPAGAWSAYSGDTIAFVNRDGIPARTVSLLVQRAKLLAAKPSIYIVGPTSVISAGVQSQLGAYGTVKRIAGPNAIATAIAFARFRDPSTGFGWGLTHGPASVSLLDTHQWGNALGGFELAATGPQAPLLLTPGPGPLPAPVVGYLRQLRATGRNQGYVLGDTASISSATLHQLDGLLSPSAG
jgi:hypothetical protein